MGNNDSFIVGKIKKQLLLKLKFMDNYPILGLCKELKNKKTIQAFQNILQRIITGAPWFVSNESLNGNLKLLSIKETADIFYKHFHSKLRANPNQLINKLASLILSGNPTRRLKRNWCRDLIT